MAETRTPQLKPNFEVITLPGRGVMLLHEDGGRALLGSLYEHLMPLLDGSLQLEEILAQLSPRFTHSEVYLTLISLQSRGYLCESI